MNNQYFFIGTEAELIKVFPVILACQKQGDICHIIASGQNDLKKNRILEYIELNGKYIELSQEESIQKSAKGLLLWFARTRIGAKKIIAEHFDLKELTGANLIVHGDTVSTYMGALVGRQLHMKVCHVEAGLRSHHLFNPFPEEIDRLLTSRIARMHFAPGQEAAHNLSKARGKVVNTRYNTILDSLCISEKMNPVTERLEDIISQEYFVFVMHRQENLMNKDFVKEVMEQIDILSHKMRCVIILHKITENVLSDMGYLSKLQQCPEFVLLPRVDYFDFMKLLRGAQYVITDGGSNQEELHYMGKPCLIMRKTTERQDGIGQNAKLFGGDVGEISRFAQNYLSYKCDTTVGKISPSTMIAEVLGQ